MSTPEEEMNEALDALEAGAGETFDNNENLDLQDGNLDDSSLDDNNDLGDDKPKEKPPGYLTYDEWVAKGKDPADFRGENAYKKQYDALKEVRELKDTMSHVVDGMETWKQQQSEQKAEEIAQARVDLVAEFEQAKEDEDIDAALAAQEKINKIDSKPTPKTPELSPIISSFTKKNPILDPKSNQYDADFHDDVSMIQAGILDGLLGGDRSEESQKRLTERHISRSLDVAFNKAKELHADKFVSPRNKRTTTAQPNKRTAQTATTAKTRLSSVEGNSRNVRDTDPANEIYELIKAKDPAAAEVFAKNLTGE